MIREQCAGQNCSEWQSTMLEAGGALNVGTHETTLFERCFSGYAGTCLISSYRESSMPSRIVKQPEATEVVEPAVFAEGVA